MTKAVEVGQTRNWQHKVYSPFKILNDGQIPGTYDIGYLPKPYQVVPDVDELHILINSRVIVDMDEELEVL